MRLIVIIMIFIGTLYAQCASYTSSECGSNFNCEWIENIESVTCGSLVWDEELCEASPDCTYSCWDAGGYFGWCEPACTGGMTYIDSGYCQEIEMPGCSEMNQSECNSDESCNWAEEIEWGNCGDLNPTWNVVYFCDDPLTNSDNCYTYTCYGGGYGQWSTCCGGDPYIIADNSYCDEVPFDQGDLNGDFTINILDIVDIVNLILNEEWNFIADMNYDHAINVLDIILVVDIILGN